MRDTPEPSFAPLCRKLAHNISDMCRDNPWNYSLYLPLLKDLPADVWALVYDCLLIIHEEIGLLSAGTKSIGTVIPYVTNIISNLSKVIEGKEVDVFLGKGTIYERWTTQFTAKVRISLSQCIIN